MEDNWAVPQNAKHGVTMWPSNSTPRWIPKRIENICLCKTLLRECSCIIHSSPNVVTTEMSIIWWMDKWNVIYPYNWVLFGNRKEWSTDTCYNVNEPWNHHAKWKKPVIKSHILYDCYQVQACSARCATGQWIGDEVLRQGIRLYSESRQTEKMADWLPLKNHLNGVWMPVSFIAQRGGGDEEVKWKGRKFCWYLLEWPASVRGCVSFFFLAAFHRWAGFPEAGHYVWL